MSCDPALFCLHARTEYRTVSRYPWPFLVILRFCVAYSVEFRLVSCDREGGGEGGGWEGGR